MDSTKKDTSIAVVDYCASGDSTTIEYWQIPDSTAGVMITNIGRRGKPSGIKYKRDHIDNKIRANIHVRHGEYIGWISARYRDGDV